MTALVLQSFFKMIISQGATTHGRRLRIKPWKPAPAPPALVLISGMFNGTFTITLDFDRAIDIAAFNGAAITLVDGPDGLLWRGQTATLLSDVSVRISLTNTGGATGDDVLLTATAASGSPGRVRADRRRARRGP